MEASQLDKSDSTNSSFAMLNSDKIKDEVVCYIQKFNNQTNYQINNQTNYKINNQTNYQINNSSNKVDGINENDLTNENTNHFMINSEELPKGLVISSLD